MLGLHYFHEIITNGSSAPYSQLGYDGAQFWYIRGVTNSTAWISGKPIRIAKLGGTPLDLPYWWFFERPSQAYWTELQSEIEWTRIAKDLSFVTTATVSGNEVDRFKLTRGDKEIYVSFARLDGYPVQVELEDRGSKKYSLEVAEMWKGPNGAVIGTEFMLTLPGQTARRHSHVLRDSIRLSEKTDDLVFQFDVGKARKIIKIDRLAPSATK